MAPGYRSGPSTLHPGERVLDLGCGPGALSKHVARAGALYTGVDASARLLRFARRHHGDHGVLLLSIQDVDPRSGSPSASAGWNA